MSTHRNSEDEEAPSPVSVDESFHSNSLELHIDSNAEDNSTGARKVGWARGRGKTRGRSQSHSGRGLIAASPQTSSSSIQCEASSTKQNILRGPRMPDGTRGFTMGRGKPLSVLAAPTPNSHIE